MAKLERKKNSESKTEREQARLKDKQTQLVGDKETKRES